MTIYKRGDIFIITKGDDKIKAMLCQTEPNTFCLMVLSSGNRWNDPVTFPLDPLFNNELSRKELLMLMSNPSTTIRRIKRATV